MDSGALENERIYPSPPAQGVPLQRAEGCITESDSSHTWNSLRMQEMQPHLLPFVVILGSQLAVYKLIP